MSSLQVSPWIREMGVRDRLPPFKGERKTDVTVVGGGIAGMSTVYHLLLQTDLDVTLLEKDMIGRGSSGRNGGQGVAVLEKSFKQLALTSSEEVIAALLNELETGYWRLREICQKVEYIGGPIETVAWTGLSSMKEIDNYLEEMSLRRRFGAPERSLIIAEEVAPDVFIPPELVDQVSTRRATEIKELLQTKESYQAVYPTPVSLVNSGRLSQVIAGHLLRQYPDRFHPFEGSPVWDIDLRGTPTLTTDEGTVRTRTVVLCTNGYPLPRIVSEHRSQVEGSIQRYVASMVAYEVSSKERPGAFIYFHEEGDPIEEPYFYLTRRPFLVTGRDLIAVGGPQIDFSGTIDHNAEYPTGVYDRIESFVKRSYPIELPDDPSMTWNGLMGYTPDGLRIVGPDPRSSKLWYNLGCNGVGLLPSIVGGWKVAQAMHDVGLIDGV